MELGVLSDNIPAQGLYKKMGFTEWGNLQEAFILDDGTVIDEITMYRKL
jgi:RimJ/RimL family protein N-acetyltransferase